eukprot:g19561.t1
MAVLPAKRGVTCGCSDKCRKENFRASCGISNLPKNVLSAIRTYPEIEDSISPMKDQPLYTIKHTSYTKITVDRVKATNQNYYPVLFIGT